MSVVAIARRYARALYDEAEHLGLTEEVGRDMDAVRSTVADSRELRIFLANPTIPREKKRSIVGTLFQGHVGDLVLRFLQLVVDKGRESMLQSMAEAYVAMRDVRTGIQEVRAATAVPLSESERGMLTEALEQFTGKRVRLLTDVDPRLLGGIVVRVGDEVRDGSIRHRLAVLRERLEEGSPIQN